MAAFTKGGDYFKDRRTRNEFPSFWNPSKNSIVLDWNHMFTDSA